MSNRVSAYQGANVEESMVGLERRRGERKLCIGGDIDKDRDRGRLVVGEVGLMVVVREGGGD